MPTFAPLETFRHTTPLIVVCSDAATQRPVTRGLSLTAIPRNGASRRSVAFSAGNGAYAFENLGGLRDLEFGASGLAGFPASPAAGSEFVLFVEDSERRYLPFGVILTLPRREWFPASLFAAPTAPPPSGLLLLRGTLTDTAQPLPGGGFAPAAYACIVAEYGASVPPITFVGLADARGQFALPLPLPCPLIPPPGIVATPSLPVGTTIADLRWPLNVRFQYAPADQRFLCRSAAGLVEIVSGPGREIVRDSRSNWRCLPDIRSLLNQPDATASAGDPPTASLTLEIGYVNEFIYRPPTADNSVRLTPP